MINLPTPQEFGLPDSFGSSPGYQMSEFFAPGQLTINFPGAPASQGSKTVSWLMIGLMALGVLFILKK